MRERSRILVLILLMSGITLASLSLALLMLYDAAFEGQRERLREIVVSRALLIEAVAAHDLEGHRTSDANQDDAERRALEATLKQIRAAHERFEGFGASGEFTMAQRDGDEIAFVLRQRHRELEPRAPIAFASELAEPMRRALEGKAGTVVALDYRGERVLAAHQPVGVHGLGLVAKIDLAEVRRPFVHAGLAVLGVATVLVALGTVLFLRIGNPIVARLERQARQLEKDNAERRQAEQRVRASLAEKELLLREVHHRVKNNLQVISSLLNMQSRKLTGTSEADLLQESRARIQTMAQVHESLYRSADLRHVSLESHVRAIATGLYRLHRTSSDQVRLTIDIADVELEIDQAIPCGMIINELLSNSLAHGFPDGRQGRVTIALAEDDVGYLLCYEDDGVGLPDGFSPERSDTLGTKLIQTFVNQLRGELQWQSQDGVRYVVRFASVRTTTDRRTTREERPSDGA